jgi:predicted secreted protein
MSKINGSALLVDINIAEAPASPDWKTICGATSHTLNLNTSLEDATTKCSGGNAEHIDGLADWSIDVDGLQDPADDYHFEDLLELKLNKTPVQVRAYVTAEAGKYLYGMASIESLSMNADMETPVGWSASFRGNGELLKSWS